jgi:hypothetical protein
MKPRRRLGAQKRVPEPKNAFYSKLGEHKLQLALIIVVGALLKEVIDWGTAQRARQRERLNRTGFNTDEFLGPTGPSISATERGM